MQHYQVYIDDDRYAVESLRFLAVASDEQAHEFAEKALAESPHHRGVELRRADARIWSKGSLPHSEQTPKTQAVVTWQRLHDEAKEKGWQALRETLTHCFRVLLYPGSSGPPSLQLVMAEDVSAARKIADELLAEMSGSVGVEVWRDERRVYARGAAPAQTRPEACLAESSSWQAG